MCKRKLLYGLTDFFLGKQSKVLNINELDHWRCTHIVNLRYDIFELQWRMNYFMVCFLLQVNIKSLEDVVRKYISLAESKTEAARAESHQAVVDIDDLDNPDTPER